MHRVLCIDESSESLNALCFALSGEYDLKVHTNPHEAVVDARHIQPDAVILDPVFNTRPVDIADLLTSLKELPSKPCIIILRDNPPLWFCDNLRRWGADAFLSKPWGVLWLRKKLSSELVYHRRHREWATSVCQPESHDMGRFPGLPAMHPPAVSLDPVHSVFDALCGSSVLMQELRTVLSVFAEEEKPVLIRGETGTGKTVAAHLLHRGSARRDRPFVIRNVAAIPGALAYAELFGCEQGAFTGANTRKGSVAEAEGGTLFLDEIGDASQELQMSLLRFLDSGCFCPLGSNHRQVANVRFICATNRPLEAMVSNGSFRRDLWHRLRVLSVSLPPLDSHREDIPELFHYWCKQARVNPAYFSCELLPWLSTRKWEGNVREFFNVLERFRVLLRMKGRTLQLEDFKKVADEGWFSECAGSRESAERG